MSLHELSEPTKRAIDWAGAISAFAAISLSQVALFVSIIAGCLSIAWYAIRLRDRLKYGPGRE